MYHSCRYAGLRFKCLTHKYLTEPRVCIWPKGYLTFKVNLNYYWKYIFNYSSNLKLYNPFHMNPEKEKISSFRNSSRILPRAFTSTMVRMWCGIDFYEQNYGEKRRIEGLFYFKLYFRGCRKVFNDFVVNKNMDRHIKINKHAYIIIKVIKWDATSVRTFLIVHRIIG